MGIWIHQRVGRNTGVSVPVSYILGGILAVIVAAILNPAISLVVAMVGVAVLVNKWMTSKKQANTTPAQSAAKHLATYNQMKQNEQRALAESAQFAAAQQFGKYQAAQQSAQYWASMAEQQNAMYWQAQRAAEAFQSAGAIKPPGLGS